jgi:hypothetical protein
MMGDCIGDWRGLVIGSTPSIADPQPTIHAAIPIANP